MKALEGAGFVHLYGLAPVLNALKAGRRDVSRPEDSIDINLLEGEEYEHELRQRKRKWKLSSAHGSLFKIKGGVR